ncbi:MAG: metallophosphoesterase family protein [Paracoccaceae bacterium]
MKILAFSDLHHSARRAAEIVAASKDADLVIGAGDFCNARKDLAEAMALLDGITAPILVVPGNAETPEELAEVAPDNVHMIHGRSMEVQGVTFFGLGCAVPPTPFGSWSVDMAEEDAAHLLSPCGYADVVVLHSPPKGVTDLTSTGLSVGSTAIRAALERLQPRLAVCGHIHDSWGETGLIGATRVVNLGPTPNWFDI